MTQMAKCLNCNQDYDLDSQPALCPHRPGGPSSLPPWPKQAAQPATTMPPELEALYKLHKSMEIDGLKSQCQELWIALERLHLWLRRTIGDLRPAAPREPIGCPPFHIEVDPSIPKGEIHMRDSAGNLYKFTNIAMPPTTEP